MSALPDTVRASSVAAMLGLDPSKSPLALFHELRGTGFVLDEPDSEDLDDDPILEGREFESAVANVVRKKFHLLINDPDDTREMRDRHIVGHRDRIFTEHLQQGVLEIKNPFTATPDGYGEPGSDVVPRKHWIQTQTYQGLFKQFHAEVAAANPDAVPVLVAPHGYLAARLRGGVELFQVGRDDEVYESIQVEVERFLHRVHQNDPPTPRDEQDMRRRWLVDETKSVVVDAGWVANAKQLKALNEQIRIAEKAASDIKTLMLGAVQDAKLVVFETAEGRRIEIGTVGANRVFDGHAFGAAHPDLLARFSKLDKSALKQADARLYNSFMRVPRDISEQTRVIRLGKALDGIEP